MKRLLIISGILISISACLWGADLTAERAEGSTSDTLTEGVHVFYLEPREIKYNLSAFSSIYRSSVEFKNLPNLGSGQIISGVLELGGKKENYIPFAWNKSEGKLSIDFNRNLDLTDDGENIFSNTVKHSSMHQYDIISLPIKFGNNVIYYNVSIMNQRNYRSDIFNISIKTAWCGEIELHGKKWLMAVQDNCNGVLNEEDHFMLLPPESIHLEDYKFLEFSALKLTTPRFYIGNHLYIIRTEMVEKDDKVLVRAEFKEEPVETGRLELTGSYIKRLILKGNNTVILDRPTSSVLVPLGAYMTTNIMLENKDPQWRVTNDQKLVGVNITREKPFILKQGGPLRNIAKAGQYYKTIYINYDLVGADGEKYSLSFINYDNPPRLAVYMGDKKIHADKFSYG